MVFASDLLHLSYTCDLTDGGIAYALHALPRMHLCADETAYKRLRKTIAAAAVELAFRRYLSQHEIPFEVRGAAPFTDPDRYDVFLRSRRCHIECSLISHLDEVRLIQDDPALLLKRHVLVASDPHAGAGYSPHDLYIFAFLFTQSPLSQSEQPQYLVHIMPDAWKHPRQWAPLGELILKSESEEAQSLAIGGQNEGREMESFTVDLLPRKRMSLQTRLFSLAYLHSRSQPNARIGVHSSNRQETHLVERRQWHNIWVQGMDIVLAGYLSHEEFGRRARHIQAGAQVLPSHHTDVKSLALRVSELRPLCELLGSAKAQSTQVTP